MVLFFHHNILRKLKENDDFASGRKTWWDKLNSFADLPDDELEKVKTGLKVKSGRRHKRRRY